MKFFPSRRLNGLISSSGADNPFGTGRQFPPKEIGCGAVERELREQLPAEARRREIDVVLVWRLDRWGRSLADLVVTLKDLAQLGVGFVSLSEALDLTTPTGRAVAGLLSVFAEFEQPVCRHA